MVVRGPIRAGLAVAVSLMATALPAVAAVGTWTPIGPYGANIRAMAPDPLHPGRVLAATQYAGVFVSDDSGATWTQKSAGLPVDLATGGFRLLYGLTVDPVSGRYFALGDKTISTSDDGGTTWQSFPPPPLAIGKFVRLYVDPVDHERLVLHNNRGVYAYDLDTLSATRVWTQPPGMTAFPTLFLTRAPSDPTVYYAVAGYNLGLYASTDGARSWTSVGSLPGTVIRDLVVDASDPTRIYVATDAGCYLGTGGGTTLTRMDDPADGAQVYCFMERGASVVAVGRGALFTNAVSSDRFDRVGDFYYTKATSSVDLGGGQFLMGTEMGVFRGTDGGLADVGSFAQSNRGMLAVDVVGVVAAGGGSDVLYAATGVGYDAGLYRSPDGGATWQLRSLGLTNPDLRSIAVYPGNPDVVYVGTGDALADTGENGGIFKSTDGGLTWTDLTPAIPHQGDRIVIAILVDPSDPDVVYASVQAFQGGIYRTGDGGKTWTRLATGLESMPADFEAQFGDFHDYFAMLSMAYDPGNTGRIYLGAGGCWGGTYHSDDGGATWLRRSQGYMEIDSGVYDFLNANPNQGLTADQLFPIHLELFDMDVEPWNPNHIWASGARSDLFGGVSIINQKGVVYRSVDRGETWQLVRDTPRSDYFGIPVTGTTMHAGRPGEVFLAARDGVQVTVDDGANWTPINEGLSTKDRFTRAITMDPDDPNRLYLATALSGVWIRDLPPVAVTLTGLAAHAVPGGAVDVSWGVADAVDHLGFYVDREAGGTRARITAALLSGREEYTFRDEHPVAGSINRYWVVEIDRSGQATSYGPVAVTVPVAGTLRLGEPAPNPARGDVSIPLLDAPAGATVSVRVFDASGRRVATVWEGTGARDVLWNRTDYRGNPVPAGIYFIEAASGSARASRRILLLP